VHVIYSHNLGSTTIYVYTHTLLIIIVIANDIDDGRIAVWPLRRALIAVIRHNIYRSTHVAPLLQKHAIITYYDIIYMNTSNRNNWHGSWLRHRNALLNTSSPNAQASKITGRFSPIPHRILYSCWIPFNVSPRYSIVVSYPYNIVIFLRFRFRYFTKYYILLRYLL